MLNENQMIHLGKSRDDGDAALGAALAAADDDMLSAISNGLDLDIGLARILEDLGGSSAARRSIQAQAPAYPGRFTAWLSEHTASADAEDGDDGHMVTAGRPAGGFWGRLPEREKELLQSAGLACVFPPGATVCVQGDPATHVFVLVSGWVKVVAVAGGGQQPVLALRGNGDVVGEVAGEVTGYRTATVQAIGWVRSIVVPYTRFAAFLDANPAAARAYRHALTQRWNDTAESLRIQSISSGAERLARLLLELAEGYGQGDEHQTTIELPLSQEELASLVSASRATVTRALRDWRQRRLVETSTRHITITDRAALTKIADLRT